MENSLASEAVDDKVVSLLVDHSKSCLRESRRHAVVQAKSNCDLRLTSPVSCLTGPSGEFPVILIPRPTMF